jgi:hypothetical protein
MKKNGIEWYTVEQDDNIYICFTVDYQITIKGKVNAP